MKDIKIVVSSILILLSFFLGYFFSKNKDKAIKIENYNTKNYVNLEILKTKIKISKNKNTIITINWKIEESSEYKLR